MGIIKAASHAVGTGLSDQWLEALEPDNMGAQTVFAKGVQLRKGTGENGKAIPGDLATDTGIALANMTLAAWDKGVGSCIMGAIDKPALTALLGIEEPQKLAFTQGRSRPDP